MTRAEPQRSDLTPSGEDLVPGSAKSDTLSGSHRDDSMEGVRQEICPGEDLALRK